MADSDESFTRHHDLLPLDTKEDVEELLRGLHKEFVAKVEPVSSGLQDCLIQNKVLTETDNESLTGPHLPVRTDKARHLFKLLHNISHHIFLRDVLPVLCHIYYYIIPPCFWKDDARRTGPEEYTQCTKENNNILPPPLPPPPPAGSHFPCQADSQRDQCLRCKIRRQVRPVAVADFLFQRGAVSFKKYCQLTKDYRISPVDWPALFSSFKSLPLRQNGSDEEELLSVLRDKPQVSRYDLQKQIRAGFPCQCHKGVNPRDFASLTKNKREQWCKYYRRWKEQQETGATSISDLSSSSLYPATECDGSSNSSCSINSSNINNSCSSVKNSGAVGSNSGEADGQHQQQENRPETSAAQASPAPLGPSTPPTPSVQATDGGDRGMVRPGDFRVSASDALPATPCTAFPALDCSMDENVEARLSRIACLLQDTCPNNFARNARTLNIRHHHHHHHHHPSPFEDEEDDHHHTGKRTWPSRRRRCQGGDSEDFDSPGLEAFRKGRRESEASVLMKELEEARSMMDIPAVIEKNDDVEEDDDDDAESSSGQSGWAASIRRRRSESESTASGWSANRSQSEITLLHSTIPAEAADSISADTEKNNIPSEKLVTVASNTSSIRSGAASTCRSQQGLVAQRIAQFQSQTAENVSSTKASVSLEESTHPGSQTSQKTECDPLQPTSRERCVEQRYPRNAGKGTTTDSEAQYHSAESASLARDSGSPARESPSGDHSGSPSSEPPARPTCLPLETSATATTLPTRQPSVTSPVSLLPARKSPDDERNKQLEKVVRKGHFEKLHSIIPHLPQKDDRPQNAQTDSGDDGEETHVSYNTPLFPVPETASTADLQNPANYDEPLSPEVCNSHFGEHHSVWEAVADAQENGDLKELCAFAATDFADRQSLMDIIRKAVITDRRAREEIHHLMDNYTCMISIFEEIRQQRQDTFPSDHPHPKTPHRVTETSPPEPKPSPPEAVPQIPSLLFRVEELCEKMLVFTRVNILCALYLHTSRKLTSEQSRTTALTMVRDVIMLGEWTSLQGWTLLIEVEELRNRLPRDGDGEVSEKVGEIVALVKTFLENA